MKNNYTQIRPLNLTEKAIIRKSLEDLSPNIFKFLIDNFDIYICFNSVWKQQSYPSMYLITHRQRVFLNSISNLRDIYSIGLYMGFIRKGELIISLELLDFLKNHDLLIHKKRIIVNQIGERSILYGNDLLKKMIVQISTDVKKDDDILILNEQNELLALGKSKIDEGSLSRLKSEDIIALNIIDKGYYLRKNQ